MAQIKPSVPGRALTTEHLMMQVALPQLVRGDEHAQTADLWAISVQRVRDAYPHTTVPPVRQLPQKITVRDLPYRGARPTADRHHR
ncbi:hypothetical protein AB3X52_13485 [Nocardioides sp. DS6]|uniref:Uncharacterized protein n=1 Tax=Nocardioides eburneus TaxID=3231482 RepID=A0ABV3T0B8_9ACTN